MLWLLERFSLAELGVCMEFYLEIYENLEGRSYLKLEYVEFKMEGREWRINWDLREYGAGFLIMMRICGDVCEGL